jgi:hypothetical protein
MRTSTEGGGLGGLVALLVASMVGVLPLRLEVKSRLAQRSGAESGKVPLIYLFNLCLYSERRHSAVQFLYLATCNDFVVSGLSSVWCTTSSMLNDCIDEAYCYNC